MGGSVGSRGCQTVAHSGGCVTALPLPEDRLGKTAAANRNISGVRFSRGTHELFGAAAAAALCAELNQGFENEG